jgi:spore coat polysaccharide biosynthesis predicted glycosyltransferase SpsG
LTRVTLAYDIGPGRGLGHRRRMESLGAALQQLGLRPQLSELAAITPSDVLVIDAYSTRGERPAFDAGVLAAVDDLERDLAVDLVVDPNPGGGSHAHAAARHILHGVRYALVGPVPAGLAPRDPDCEVERVLVTTGGSDEHGVGAALAERVHRAVPDVDVRLVIGPWSSRDVPAGVTPVDEPDGLWSELAAADLVVTAGGVTMIEACSIGRPTVALALADNQRRAVAGAVAAGAVVGCDPTDAADHVAQEVVAVARDRGRRAALSEAAARWVDGRGARRVAEALVALV